MNFTGPPAPPSEVNVTQLADLNLIILGLQWSPDDSDSGLVYQVEVCWITNPDECPHRSLVRDTMDLVVLNRNAGEELLVSVRTYDRCGRMSQGSVNRTVTVQGKSV